MHMKSKAVVWAVQVCRPDGNRKLNIYELGLKGPG